MHSHYKIHYNYHSSLLHNFYNIGPDIHNNLTPISHSFVPYSFPHTKFYNFPYSKNYIHCNIHSSISMCNLEMYKLYSQQNLP